MTGFDIVASALARPGVLLGEIIARASFALWLGTPWRAGSADRVFIHIDEWGRITRLRTPRGQEPP
jgi:hypothetical protein